jgi:hypothetical protein
MTREVREEPGVLREHYPELNASLLMSPQPCNRTLFEQYQNGRRSHPDHWFGLPNVSTPAEALAEISKGNTGDIIGRVKRYKYTLERTSGVANRKVRAPVAKRVRNRGDAGNELDEHYARIGRHDIAWAHTKRAPVVMGLRRAVLTVGMANNCDVSAADMDWRAAASWLIYEKLMGAGYAVEILVSEIVHGPFMRNSDRIEVTFVAKPFLMPMSVERVAVVCSGAFFRTAGFMALACVSRDNEVSESFGRAKPNDRPLRAKEMAEEGALVLRVPADTLSETAAQAAFNSAMDALDKRRILPEVA